jgi:hypothetical protein
MSAPISVSDQSASWLISEIEAAVCLWQITSVIMSTIAISSAWNACRSGREHARNIVFGNP